MSGIKLALLGCGTVGTEVVRLLHEQSADLTARVGAQLELVGIAVRRPGRDRGPLPDDRALFTTDALGLVKRDDVDVVVEVVGGIEPARTWLVEALRGGKSVVTANKALLAEDGPALHEATALGYAEPDPTADVEGFDAAAKAAILASLAFHTRVRAADVYREGITEVTATDVASAKAMGCVIKLLCIAERSDDTVSVRVHPAMIPRTHPLASVGDAFNAVFVEAAAAGQLMFYGRGAGGAPTASAVLGDIVAVARNRLSGVRAAPESVYADLRVRPIGEVATRYNISLDVADRAGVLATVASVFARHGVSIATVHQSGRGDDAVLVIVTHGAPDAALGATVTELRALDIVRSVASVLRVEGE